MPKVVSPQVLDRIIELIARHPDRIGMEALSQSLNIPRRTLQRHLSMLVGQKRMDFPVFSGHLTLFDAVQRFPC